MTSKRRILGQESGFPPGPTLVSALKDAVDKKPNRPVFVYPDGKALSMSQFYALGCRVAKGIVAAGLEPGQGVCILGANAVEWFAADWGAVLSATIPAPSYVTNSAQVLAYILDLTNAGICFVDNEEGMVKVLSAKAQSTNNTLRVIVVWDPNIDFSNYRDHASLLLNWHEFIQSGNVVPDAVIDERMALANPESCAKLIFTSGTTGHPKAAMISHDNMCWTAYAIVRQFRVTIGDTMVSYLPASHIASNALDCVGPCLSDVTVYLARADALRGSLIDTLREVRPTIFVAVPRVWEKIHDRMNAMRSSMSRPALLISDWAKAIGTKACRAEDEGQPLPWGTFAANHLVHANVRYALGLNNARLILNTASPLLQTTGDYFRSFRIKIMDIYGMSESTGPFTCSTPWHYRYGSSGTPLEGIEIKIDKKDGQGEGELWFRGRNVFLGYFNNPESTAEVFDDDGFFHTGDLGKVDPDGFVFITGRAKELLKTSGGENVAPLLIEGALQDAMPAIEYAVAIGDKRKFIACLVVPDMNESGDLVGSALEVSTNARTGAEAATNAEWQDYVSRGVQKANENAISSVAKVKKFCILAQNFSLDSAGGKEKGELTPTFKVRRQVVEEKYADQIERMYK